MYTDVDAVLFEILKNKGFRSVSESGEIQRMEDNSSVASLAVLEPKMMQHLRHEQINKVVQPDLSLACFIID